MLDPYTDKYKKLKNRIVSGSLNASIHYDFCKKLAEVYECRVLDGDLSRMPHNQRLRLELFVYDQEDCTRINRNPWDQMVQHNIGALRQLYKDAINKSAALAELMSFLNVSEGEIDDLFITLSPFIPCLRWDLNINLDKAIEARFFQQFFPDKAFRILKEFEEVVVLSQVQHLNKIEEEGLGDTITREYVKLLENTSPLTDTFTENRIQLYFEEETYFNNTFGNLRNYLN